jgi:CheY-like chemotaxis protein
MSYSYLIIDSSTTTRALLKRTIRQTEFGHGRIYEASSGAEAIESLEHHRVDMILIDPRLTDMEGVELIGRIRSEPETRGIPVVAMVVRTDARKAEAHRRAGVCAHLRKPFTGESFCEVVTSILEPTHV